MNKINLKFLNVELIVFKNYIRNTSFVEKIEIKQFDKKKFSKLVCVTNK